MNICVNCGKPVFLCQCEHTTAIEAEKPSCFGEKHNASYCVNLYASDESASLCPYFVECREECKDVKAELQTEREITAQ